MVANSPGPAYFRRFSTSLAEARPQFETQAAFNKYSRILWPSGECGPTSPKVAGSNPDFCNFSAKNGNFPKKSAPSHNRWPRGESPAAVYAQYAEY